MNKSDFEMRRFLSVLFLASVFLFNSGFEQSDSTSSNQTELVVQESQASEEDLAKSDFEMKKDREDFKEPQSLAEKLGSYLVATATYFFKMIVTFVVNFIR